MCPADVARPWSEVPAAALRGLRGVLTDIDDTLTRQGQLQAAALEALQALQAAGLPVIAVTGRPQGWCEPFARAWPLRAIVAENGAVLLHRGPSDGAATGSRTHPPGLAIEYRTDAETRAGHARRLRAVARRILREVPGAALARDSAGRVTDIAIDHAEHHRLDAAAIGRVVALMQEAGLKASVSSIHVNGWIGEHDKFEGARWALQRLLGRALEAEPDGWIYVGDSPNDEVMFRRLPLTVGVANLLDFAGRVRCWPTYLTLAPRGQGFAEVARRLLAERAAASAADGAADRAADRGADRGADLGADRRTAAGPGGGMCPGAGSAGP